jgi:hypothetical protein
MAGVVASTTAASVSAAMADFAWRAVTALGLRARATAGDDARMTIALVVRIVAGVLVWVGTLGLAWSLRSRRVGPSARPGGPG